MTASTPEPIPLADTLALWAEGVTANTAERVLLWSCGGGRRLRLASNFPYELWLDGTFVGDGGLRCAPGEALLDTWDARAAKAVTVRLHYLSPTQSSVWYRCLFDDPFFADLDVADWSCHDDASVLGFAAKMTSQLPRQNRVAGRPRPGAALRVIPAATSREWSVIESGLKPARYVPIDHPAASVCDVPGTGDEPFDPIGAGNVVLAVRGRAPRGLVATTYDLGQIALHRVEVRATSAVAVCYGEVPGFLDTWGTPNRKKVHLADAVAPADEFAAPFGTRGCRYVHVVHRPEDRVELRAWRREYPLAWKPVRPTDPTLNAVLDGCRRTLVACVDGGVVDTCWRERAQWVGDLRLSALAVSALADNPEVVACSLRQIATSYDDSSAMVQGAWPIRTPEFRELTMPTYHLAYCLTALESGTADPTVRGVVDASLPVWRWKYLRDGLLRHLPGWHFTDWDFHDPDTHRQSTRGAHAVANAWYHEACGRVGLPGIDVDAFRETFWDPQARGWRLVEGGPPSPHATAVAMTALDTADGFDFLADLDLLRARVSPYFGFYVAKAIGRVSRERMLQFVRDFYGPIVARHGTIYEKATDTASLAHGWSVGVAALVAEG